MDLINQNRSGSKLRHSATRPSFGDDPWRALTHVWSPCYRNAQELKRWLAKQGCTFDTAAGDGGHIFVFLGDRRTIMPTHGSRKELAPGLVHKIKKDLGLK